MEDYPLCPPWWPKTLWELHFAVIPFNRPDVGSPINKPATVDAILASLEAHTASYLMGDEKLAAQIRTAAIQNMISLLRKLEVGNE
jgi:hypothetical protein